MASERETFDHAGPYFLTAIDWNNPMHTRSIAASLVQGVYQLEHDRHHNRQDPHALAQPWWEFFNFKKFRELVDNHDGSVFGAIFEFKSPRPPTPVNPSLQRSPPLYVIAFRGTIKKATNIVHDLIPNLHYKFNNLEKINRFDIGYEEVRRVANSVSSRNIWLAGHSLGASIALNIGREMARTDGYHVETYLFNPPFISPLTCLIKNDELRHVLMFTESVIKATLAVAVNGRKKARESDEFTKLSSWVPHLFINPKDLICKHYEEYFEQRKKMESIGAERIGRIATQHSMGSVVSAARGKVGGAVHLIPSAKLSINCSPCSSSREAHGIRQWWRQDLELKCNIYQYK